MKNKSVIVIGAGASGMVAAITAAQNGAKVTILEKNQTLGKKILVTGNGRCNFTNKLIESSKYSYKDKRALESVFTSFGLTDTLEFFEDLGIEPYRIGDLYYPRSLQAKSIRDCLVRRLNELDVKIYCSTAVTEITKTKKGYLIYSDKETFNSDTVIISCGGKSYPNTGSEGDGYKLLEKLGHTIVTPLPALCGLECSDKLLKKASGVRISSRIEAYVSEEKMHCESGELQITDYGISGIVTMIISNYLTRAIYDKKNCYVLIDFISDIDRYELFNKLKLRFERYNTSTNYESLIGLFPDKLINVFLRKAGINPDEKSIIHMDNRIWDLVNVIKEYKLNIVSTKGFSHAQITDGGVPLEEVDTDTFGSLINKNIYITGELLDVTGFCGGFNLQWAWTSGYLAGRNAAIGE